MEWTKEIQERDLVERMLDGGTSGYGNTGSSELNANRTKDSVV